MIEKRFKQSDHVHGLGSCGFDRGRFHLEFLQRNLIVGRHVCDHVVKHGVQIGFDFLVHAKIQMWFGRVGW